jgi:beta-lactamase superfamily II metal-dependent hydrolase
VSRVIIFDVDHGFCAFVKSRTGRTLTIDCGRKENFSPVVYVIENELGGQPLTQLLVSHPHDDHIGDIESITSKLPPLILRRQRYNWEDVKEGEGDYENLDHYAEWQVQYSVPASPVDWGDVDIKTFSLTPTKAYALNQNNWVNNSGIVVVVTITGSTFTEKFVFGADVETDGWIELLKNSDFKAAVKNAWFYVVSHHGHTSGFSTELYDAMGKPFLNLISVTSGDEHADNRYSSDEYAIGTQIGGEKRYSLTTRTDGSIFIDVNEKGQFSASTLVLADNEGPVAEVVKAFFAKR